MGYFSVKSSGHTGPNMRRKADWAWPCFHGWSDPGWRELQRPFQVSCWSTRRTDSSGSWKFQWPVFLNCDVVLMLEHMKLRFTKNLFTRNWLSFQFSKKVSPKIVEVWKSNSMRMILGNRFWWIELGFQYIGSSVKLVYDLLKQRKTNWLARLFTAIACLNDLKMTILTPARYLVHCLKLIWSFCYWHSSTLPNLCCFTVKSILLQMASFGTYIALYDIVTRTSQLLRIF